MSLIGLLIIAGYVRPFTVSYIHVYRNIYTSSLTWKFGYLFYSKFVGRFDISMIQQECSTVIPQIDSMNLYPAYLITGNVFVNIKIISS